MKLEKVSLYILKLSDRRFYCGITNNINRRFREHTQQNKSWASKIGVIKIEYIREFDSRVQACRMEKKVKIFGVSNFVKYLNINNKSKF